MANIIEVLEYGPICAADEDTGCVVTVNGAYVNLWVPDGKGEYTNTDCVANSEWGDLYKRTGAEMIERAESCRRDWLVASGEEA